MALTVKSKTTSGFTLNLDTIPGENKNYKVAVKATLQDGTTLTSEKSVLVEYLPVDSIIFTGDTIIGEVGTDHSYSLSFGSSTGKTPNVGVSFISVTTDQSQDILKSTVIDGSHFTLNMVSMPVEATKATVTVTATLTDGTTCSKDMSVDLKVVPVIAIIGTNKIKAKGGAGSADYVLTFTPEQYNVPVSLKSVTSSDPSIVVSNATMSGFTLSVSGITADVSGVITAVLSVDGVEKTYQKAITAIYYEVLTPLILMNTTDTDTTFSYKMGSGAATFEICVVDDYTKGNSKTYDFDSKAVEVELTTDAVSVTLKPGESFSICSHTYTPSSTNYLQFVITSKSVEFDGDVLGPVRCKMVDYACYHLFDGCTGLSETPELPATTLASYCYSQMFSGCTGLTTAPELLANTLVSGCYSMMFSGCSALNFIRAMFTTTPSTDYTDSWVSGVASSGTFVKNTAATWDVTGVNGIPSGWTVKKANEVFEEDELIAKNGNGICVYTLNSSYIGKIDTVTTNNSNIVCSNIADTSFTLTASNITESSTFNISITDKNGNTYTYSASVTYKRVIIPLILMNTTDTDTTFSYKMGAGSSSFDVCVVDDYTKGSSAEYDFSSNISSVSLTTTEVSVTLSPGQSFAIFSENYTPSSSNYLQFVITSKSVEFDGDVLGPCGGKMVDHACYYMFKGCTGLTTAPELPATTLNPSCYSRMFYACTGLTTAPELPATKLVNSCYSQMFYNCTGLTTAPELPATMLEYNCYYNLFFGCTGLKYIKAMFTTKPDADYTNNWVNGVASSGTFVKNSSATWDVTGVTGINGIPFGWTVEYATE